MLTNKWKSLGDKIGLVIVESGCYMVYCDEYFQIANKSVDCPTTVVKVSYFDRIVKL